MINQRSGGYLRQYYGEDNVVVPEMETGYIFSGCYSEQVAHSVLQSGVTVLKEELRKQSFNLIIGSSMGGATITEALSRGGQLFKCHILLLAPALKKVRNKFGFNDNVEGITEGAPMSLQSINSEINSYRATNPDPNTGSLYPLYVVHGREDNVIPFEDSEGLVEKILGARLIEVPDGDHSLNNYLLDGIVTSKERRNGKVTGTDGSQESVLQRNNFKRIMDELLS